MDYVAVACQVVSSFKCILVSNASLKQNDRDVEVRVKTLEHETYTVRFKASAEPKGSLFEGYGTNKIKLASFIVSGSLGITFPKPVQDNEDPKDIRTALRT